MQSKRCVVQAFCLVEMSAGGLKDISDVHHKKAQLSGFHLAGQMILGMSSDTNQPPTCTFLLIASSKM